MRKNSISIWLMLLILFFYSVSAWSIDERKKFQKTVDFKSGGLLTLTNTNGFVEIESWNKNQVEIIAEIKVRGGSRSDQKDFIDKVEILIDKRGNRIDIESDYPRNRNGRNSFWNAVRGSRRPQVTINYRIRVPLKIELDVETTNGSIEIMDIDGDIDTHSTNGNITTENIEGSISAKTTNGSIDAEMKKINEDLDMDFSTTNGSIKIYLPQDVDAEVEARTTNGRIYSDYKLDSNRRRKYSRKHFRGQINAGGPLIRMRTTNGSIYINER